MFTDYETFEENSYTLRQHLTKTFLWMFLGIGITALTSYIGYTTGFFFEMIITVNGLNLILLIAQLGVVIAFSTRLTKLKVNTARMLYIAYSILTGFTFTILFYAYEVTTIIMAFTLASLYFGSLAFIGYTTKKDLTKIGTICMGALLAMVIYTIFAMLFTNQGANSIIMSYLGLLIFAGLTAWDAQKLKGLYLANTGNTKVLDTLSIYSAFELYLDFINIFLYILRIVGSSNND